MDEIGMGEAQRAVSEKEVHRESVGVLGDKIGRSLDRTEQKAVGFVLDRRWEAGQTTEGFMKKLGLEEKDLGNAAAEKVRMAVYNASIAEIARKIEEATVVNDLAGVEKLQAVREYMEAGNRLAEKGRRDNPEAPIYIGGVPEYWLPAWFTE